MVYVLFCQSDTEDRVWVGINMLSHFCVGKWEPLCFKSYLHNETPLSSLTTVLLIIRCGYCRVCCWKLTTHSLSHSHTCSVSHSSNSDRSFACSKSVCATHSELGPCWKIRSLFEANLRFGYTTHLFAIILFIINFISVKLIITI